MRDRRSISSVAVFAGRAGIMLAVASGAPLAIEPIERRGDAGEFWKYPRTRRWGVAVSAGRLSRRVRPLPSGGGKRKNERGARVTARGGYRGDLPMNTVETPAVPLTNFGSEKVYPDNQNDPLFPGSR